jgi:hypothetical protein
MTDLLAAVIILEAQAAGETSHCSGAESVRTSAEELLREAKHFDARVRLRDNRHGYLT